MSRESTNRARVIATAAEIADRDGLDAASLSAVARALGMRTPSLYRHVASHADLVDGIAVLALTELQSELSAAAAGRAGRDAIDGVAHAYRRYASTAPGRYAATAAVPVRDASDELKQAAVALLEILHATLRAWELTPEAEVDAIRGLRAAMHGFIELERSGGFGLDRSTDTSFAALIAALTAGLGPEHSAA